MVYLFLFKALFLCELHFATLRTSRPLNHQRTNKQPINFRYNCVKNFTSILCFCIGLKCVSSNDDTKALFHCGLHFARIFTSRSFNHQRTIKQFITLRNNDMKNLISFLSCCNSVNIVPSKKD